MEVTHPFTSSTDFNLFLPSSFFSSEDTTVDVDRREWWWCTGGVLLCYFITGSRRTLKRMHVSE